MSILYLVIYGAVCGGACATIADYKNRDVEPWFFCGLLLGVIGMFIIACVPPLPPTQKRHDSAGANGILHV